MLQLPIISKPPSWPISALLFRFLSHQGGNDSYRGKAANNSKSNLATFHLLQYGKTIWSQGYHTYKALSPQPDRSSLLHHHRAHHAVPTPPALGRHFWFQIHFQRGKLSFCAAKSMDDLSLAFRNLHKLHNSRSSVNYLDVAAWTCAWKVFSRSLFKLNFQPKSKFLTWTCNS